MDERVQNKEAKKVVIEKNSKRLKMILYCERADGGI